MGSTIGQGLLQLAIAIFIAYFFFRHGIHVAIRLRNLSEKFGGVQYLFTRRELSDSAVTASIHAIFGTDGPTLAEWQRGTAWAQVECKGSYRDAQMRDQYEWLAMVRRHADEK